MVDLDIRDDELHVTVLGWSVVWALRRRVRVPLSVIRSIRHDPAAARLDSPGFRLPGTYVPGLIRAGTYRRRGEKSLWDVRDPNQAVIIEIEDGPYDRLVVQVKDPDEAVRMVRGHGPDRARTRSPGP